MAIEWDKPYRLRANGRLHYIGEEYAQVRSPGGGQRFEKTNHSYTAGDSRCACGVEHPLPGRSAATAVASSKFTYVESPFGHMRESVEGMVERAAGFAARDLGLAGGLEVRYFRQARPAEAVSRRAEVEERSEDELMGFTRRFESQTGRVWVRWNLGARDAVATLAHEARHVWQAVTGFTGDRECDAAAFEAYFTRRYCGFSG
jgi:hypothetical protein